MGVGEPVAALQAGALGAPHRLCIGGSSRVWGSCSFQLPQPWAQVRLPPHLLGKHPVLFSHRAWGWQPGEDPPLPSALRGATTSTTPVLLCRRPGAGGFRSAVPSHAGLV